MTNKTANSNGLGKGEIAQIAAAASALTGVLTGLAVSGILGQAQRNHGILLLIAFALVLFGALGWVAVALPGMPPTGDRKLWVQVPALIVFVAGVIAGIAALWRTQTDAERPAVSALFSAKNRILSAHSTAHGLSSEDRLVVLISGLRPDPRDRSHLLEDPNSLYYAQVGPDANGEVSYNAVVSVPARYAAVTVKAWSGERETECRTEQVSATQAIPQSASQHAQAGCLIMRLPRRRAP